MKTSVKYYLLVIGISLLPLISIFVTPQLFHSHDGYVHLARIAAYYKALQDGEFPVRWAGSLNYGYGMPLFNFMYQVPYFIAASLLFVGLHLVTTFKISIALSYPLAGIFMFAFAKEFFGDNRKAFLIAIFYQFAPFRLVELLIRGSFGEVYTYAFLPLVLFGIVRLSKKSSYTDFLLTSVATALLILSHNALSLIFFGLAVGFVLVCSSNKKSFFQGLVALLSGLLLSAFYWARALLEHKYTYGDLFMKDLYLEHFPPIQNFFLPNFFNDIHLQTKGISVQVGLFHVLAILFTIAALVKKNITDKKIKKLLIGNLVILLLTFFIMQPVSKFIWAHVAILRQFQFSWRFLGVVSFISSVCAISFFSFSFFKKSWVYTGVIVLTILTTVYYWKPALGYEKINEAYYWNYPLTSTYFGETDVIWSEGPAKSYPKNRLEFIDGSGHISHFTHNTMSQSFTVDAAKDSKLVDHLEYFPGWRVYVNNKVTPIQFQDANWRGQIIFSVPKGKSTVHVVFGETPIRLITDIISLAMIGIFSLLSFRLVRNLLYLKVARLKRFLTGRNDIKE